MKNITNDSVIQFFRNFSQGQKLIVSKEAVLLTLRAFLGGLYTSTTVLRVFFSIIQKVLAISKRNFVPQNQIYEQKF